VGVEDQHPVAEALEVLVALVVVVLRVSGPVVRV